MTTTSIQEEMLRYFVELNIKEQQSILDLIKTFVNRSQRQSLEEYNDELEEAVSEIEAGHFLTHEEVKKRILK